MESPLLHSVGLDISSDRTIGLIMTVLESGHSVELPSTGYSMFPTLKPGDSVVVKPMTAGEFPKPGSVVVYIENNVLVMHRLVEINNNDSGNQMLITRGDSGRESDKPWHQEQLIGMAISYKRRRKEHSIKTFTPGACRYLFNHRLLWVFNKVMLKGV